MKKLIMLLMLLVSITSFAQKPEELKHSATSYVDDFDNIFSAEQSKDLDGIIRNFKDTVQISIVTVHSLEKLEPFEFAARLANSWGVGSASNNGLLILICIPKHKFYAATGKGIEGDLTDLTSAEYYRCYAKPLYLKNDYYGGTKAVLLKYIERLSPYAKELKIAQDNAILRNAELTSDNTSGMLVGVLIIVGICGIIIYSIRKTTRERRHKENELLKLKNKYNDAILAIDQMTLLLKKEPSITEGVELLNSIELLNTLKTDLPDIKKMVAYLKAYDAFIKNSAVSIKHYNDKKKTIDNAIVIYNKYNAPLWRINCLKLVDNLTNGLYKMYFDKGSNYEDDIKQMRVIVTSILEKLTALKKHIDNAENDYLTVLITSINNLEDNFTKLNSKLSNAIIVNNDKLSKTENGKAQILHEINNCLNYVNKPGVSLISAEQTRKACGILKDRLVEFDNVDIVKSYEVYLVLNKLIDSCRIAMNEHIAYEAEEQRILKEKIDAEAKEKKRKEEEEEQVRMSTTYYSSSSYVSDTSYNDSSSSSSSDFGGGAFDGSGSGGDF